MSDSDERKPATGIATMHQPTVCLTSAIGEFDERQGTWRDYIERFEFFCEAQGISEDDRRRALLLAGIGQTAYQRVKTILAPTRPSEMSYRDIVMAVQDHVDPKQSVIVSRFRFHQKCQGSEQGIKEFVADLKVMADPCDFGSSRDDMLRDRFVCGLADQALQKRLLTEEDTLTFQQAQRIALAAETATKSARQLAAQSSDLAAQDVHRVGSARQVKGSPSNRYVRSECFRCGGTNHSPQTCRFKTYKCHSCGEQGHLSRKCRKNDQDHVRASQAKSTHCVLTDESVRVSEPSQAAEEDNVCSVYTVGEARSPPITVDIIVFGVPVTFEVDTGSASTLMNARTFEVVKTTGGDDSLELRRSSARLRTYTGEPIPVEGEFSAVIHYGEQHLELPVVVVDTAGPNLLGRDWMKFLQLDWQTIKQETRGGAAGRRGRGWGPRASAHCGLGVPNRPDSEARRVKWKSCWLACQESSSSSTTSWSLDGLKTSSCPVWSKCCNDSRTPDFGATPHATTGESPGKLLIGYKPVTRFDKLKPDLQGCIGAQSGDC
ncbi:uncharacterized protein LOC122368489 isoform X1 [Amphibalanus amphitrite]|nr:uncharacterized protein LOC122368489 isoform X1 [Amphibalanus amphitrite]